MLTLLFILLEIGLQSCSAICYNYFPKVIGGFNDNTFINDYDADNNTIYLCGHTFDNQLSGYS